MMSAKIEKAYSADPGRGHLAQTERFPGTEGVWIFIFFDMVIFLLIFFVFMTERQANYESYKESQKLLNVFFGFANALILLTSSWLVVESIAAARQGQSRKVSARLWLALLLGLLFVGDKVAEYYQMISHGASIKGNLFFQFYFFITFAHLMHVVIGMIFLGAHGNPDSRYIDSERYTVGLENAGLFWHYVDVLWIFIFPLLYLA